MWSLDDCRHAFVAVWLVGTVALCVPSVLLYVRLPAGERFSELYILGPTHMAENYPFNVAADTSYMVYLGVTNHLGNTSYYEVQVKLRNPTEPLPNVTVHDPSSQPALYTYEVSLGDGQTWEDTLNFSFSQMSFESNDSSVGKIQVNGAMVSLNESSTWDGTNNGYYYQVFAELWVYNNADNSFMFHDRFVSLWLNMTSPV